MVDTVNTCRELNRRAHVIVPVATYYEGARLLSFFILLFAKEMKCLEETVGRTIAPQSLTGEMLACQESWNVIGGADLV